MLRGALLNGGEIGCLPSPHPDEGERMYVYKYIQYNVAITGPITLYKCAHMYMQLHV